MAQRGTKKRPKRDLNGNKMETKRDQKGTKKGPKRSQKGLMPKSSGPVIQLFLYNATATQAGTIYQKSCTIGPEDLGLSGFTAKYQLSRRLFRDL